MNHKQCLSGAIVISIILFIQMALAVSSPAKAEGQKRAKQKKKAHKQEQGFFCGGGVSWTTDADGEIVLENETPDAVLGQVIRKVIPGYPSEAIAARVEGKVVVEAIISKAGEVASIKSVSGDLALTEASTESAKGWRFTPTIVKGEAVEALAKITFKYDLGIEKESSKDKTKVKKMQR